MVVAVITTLVVISVNAATRHVLKKAQQKTACVFAIRPSNVTFYPTKHKSVVVPSTTITFEATLPVDVE